MKTASVRPEAGCDADVGWYVRKYRCEHEDSGWDERRVQPYVLRSTDTGAARVLAKFVVLALGLIAVLSVVVSAIQ